MEITTNKRFFLAGKNKNGETFLLEGELIFNAINVNMFRITETDKLFDDRNEAEAYRSLLLQESAKEHAEDIKKQNNAKKTRAKVK